MADPLAERPAQAPGEADQRDARGHAASKVAIARAIAGAVRSVPGVTGLSRGHSALAATYGPTGLVTGVVVYAHQSRTPNEGGDAKNEKAGEAIQFPEETRIEVHVTVDASATLSSPRNDESETAASGSDDTALDRALGEGTIRGFLPAMAEEIRRAARSAATNMGLPTDVAVDVFIDDLD
jgi:hypothetical protein